MIHTYTKICVRCKIEKNIKDFYKNPRTKDKLRNWCKTCCSESCKKFREKRKNENYKKKEFYTLEIGKKYKEWTLLDIININGVKKVKVICSCGFIKTQNEYYFKICKTESCITCAYKRRSANNNNRLNSRIFEKLKCQAKRRKLEFDLDKEFLYELLKKQNFKCALSGLDLRIANTAAEHEIGFTNLSLDRIDSNGGYTKNNVQWVHKLINVMKWSLSKEIFIFFCREVANNNKDLKINYDERMEFWPKIKHRIVNNA